MLAALWLSVALRVLMEGVLAEAEGMGAAGPHYRADCAPRGDGRLRLFRAQLLETPAELPRTILRIMWLRSLWLASAF